MVTEELGEEEEERDEEAEERKIREVSSFSPSLSLSPSSAPPNSQVRDRENN